MLHAPDRVRFTVAMGQWQRRIQCLVSSETPQVPGSQHKSADVPALWQMPVRPVLLLINGVAITYWTERKKENGKHLSVTKEWSDCLDDLDMLCVHWCRFAIVFRCHVAV